MTGEIYLTPTGHAKDCDWHVDQYPWECTCGFIPRKKAMDDLIAQDADLIDFPLVEAVRELLTDDSMEHLGVFTHNLVQALDKHGLKVVSADYLDKVAKLEEFARAVVRYAGNNCDDYLADKARAALAGDSHDQ